jgi:hypothetical protein
MLTVAQRPLRLEASVSVIKADDTNFTGHDSTATHLDMVVKKKGCGVGDRRRARCIRQFPKFHVEMKGPVVTASAMIVSVTSGPPQNVAHVALRLYIL